MERIAIALRDLLIENMSTDEVLTSDCLTGSSIINVGNTSNYKIDDEVFLIQTVSGTPVFENSRLKITEIIDDKVINLNQNVANDFLVSNGAHLQKAINYQILQCIYIGDLPTLPRFPCITISPVSEDNEWLTLRGTTHEYKFQIRLYVQADNYETTNLYIPKAARYIREVLMEHIHPLIDAESHPLTFDMLQGSSVVRIADTSSFEPGLTFIRDNMPHPNFQEARIVTILSGTNVEISSQAKQDYLVSRGAEIFKLNRILYDTRPTSIRNGFSPQKGGQMLKVAEIEYFAKEYICRDATLIG